MYFTRMLLVFSVKFTLLLDHLTTGLMLSSLNSFDKLGKVKPFLFLFYLLNILYRTTVLMYVGKCLDLNFYFDEITGNVFI